MHKPLQIALKEGGSMPATQARTFRFRSPKWLARLRFFTHRRVETCPVSGDVCLGKGWTLTERRSGFQIISSQSSRQQAKQKGKELLLAKGRKKTLAERRRGPRVN